MATFSKQQGPIRTVIELNGPALRLFSQRDQNIMIRTAMRVAAMMWIAVFLPKRFTNYARTFLGYRATWKYERQKDRLAKKGVLPGPQPTPLVYTGVSRAGALAGARATATSTLKKAFAIIRYPRGAINFKKADVLQRIPAHEITRMAEEVGRELPAYIATGTSQSKGAARTIVGAVSRLPDRAVPRRVR